MEYEELLEEGILCDAKYCPYLAGKTNRLGACEGDWCEEAFENYQEEAGL